MKIISLNVNGIMVHLNELELTIRVHKPDVILLQETHKIDREKVNKWSNNLGFAFYHNAPDKQETNLTHFFAGTAIMLKSNLTSEGIVYKTIINYRTCALDLQYQGRSTKIVNIYGPPYSKTPSRVRSQLDFYKNLTSRLASEEYNVDLTILAGDFNAVTDVSDVFQTKNFKLTEGEKALDKYIQESTLFDPYHDYSPNKPINTIRRTNQSRRIDRLYISKSAKTQIRSFSYFPNLISDLHFPAIEITQCKKLKWSMGNWRNNTAHYQNPEFIEIIENRYNLFLGHLESANNLLDWWDDTKVQIKKEAISYGIRQKQIAAAEQQEIEDEIRK